MLPLAYRALHSGMDHSEESAESSTQNESMDTMADTSSSGFCSGSGTVMMNGFQTSFNPKGDGMMGSCVTYLWHGAVLNTQAKYIAGVAGTFAMAASVELLRSFRATVRAGAGPQWSQGLAPWAADVFDSALLGVQMTIAYFLMLIVMTYESVLFSAIIIGLVIGHLFTLHRERRRATTAFTNGTPFAAGVDKSGGAGVTAPIGAMGSGTPCCGYEA